MKTFRKKPLRKASSKAQSAMEYLMTYGWAILIISVVLAALFQLGVFNPMTFAPKAPPGSCQVFRPNGPGTTSFINLEGVCSGELPQYVAQFNGQSSYITVGNSLSLSPSTFTLVGWIKFFQNKNWMLIQRGIGFNPNVYYIYGDYVTAGSSGNPPVCSIFNSTSVRYDTFFGTLTLGQWYFLACTLNSTGIISTYVNGVLKNENQMKGFFGANAYPLWIGQSQVGGWFINGSIANVQIYNTSLSANEIQALYLEGIGGAPINLQHLVAWWPLNGNANDYSGNGNNGVPINVIYVSNWYSGYTPP